MGDDKYYMNQEKKEEVNPHALKFAFIQQFRNTKNTLKHRNKDV